jgi:hypothetical protein
MIARALITACLVFSAGAAAAQAVCAPREQIVKRLNDTYGETRQGYGLQNAQLIVELYASEETGTWTLIATRPNGVACAMAVGKEWRSVEEALQDPPA